MNGLHSLIEWILIGLLCVLILFVTFQIISRLTSWIPTFMWVEEITRFCFSWLVLLGATVAVRERLHFDIDLLPWLSAKGSKWVSVMTYLLMLVVGFVFIWYGADFFLFGKNLTAELSDIPLGIVFIAWPMAGTVWSIFLIEKIYDELRPLHGGTSL